MARMFAALALTALMMSGITGLQAAPCKDAKGKFVKMPACKARALQG